MKINLTKIDQTQFRMDLHVLPSGETVWLVQPINMGVKWNEENKIFRSSVWDMDGNPVSLSFFKFVNWGENSDNFPVPTSLENTVITEKIDGSLLIVSKYKNNLILRTRGTVDATKLDNGYELELFKEKFIKSLTHDTPDTWGVSLLFEWVSPTQKIVINYGDQPEWYMVGIINHIDYSLHNQSDLDMWAKNRGFLRPTTYTFPSIGDLMQNVKQWKGKEGIVIYSNNGQTLHKIKGFWYLALHRMKEALASFEKVVDVWFEQGQPSYQKFEEFITNQFDFELWSQIRGEASRICDASKAVDQIIEKMQIFVTEVLKPLPNRKDQAAKVLSSYGNTNRASFVFKLLDGKLLDVDDKKKLLYQVLKK